jgi:tetrahydromethanopterin S-methyltransferase subunit B
MSEKDLQALLTKILNEQLKEVVAVFQANQPTETSRVTALLKEVVVKELEPIKQHLKKQDHEIKEIKENVKTISLETQPFVDGKKTISNIFKFILWTSPIAVIYSLYKWLKI